jgi:broad specificity phosphatase PhoE
MRVRFWLVAAGLFGGSALAPAQTTTVYVVRHAERASMTDVDSPLSDAGRARAVALSMALANAGLDAAVVTSRIRTQQTAAPVVDAHRLPVDTVAFGASTTAHVQTIAALLRGKHAGKSVLVVGHSETVPAIVTALGGPPLPNLCANAYATIFVVTMTPARTAVARLSYGDADPPDAASCAGMTPR